MIPNNNFSVLPWYTSIDQQNARKWWAYGRVYPLFTIAGTLLPWQLLTTHDAAVTKVDITSIVLHDGNTDDALGEYVDNIRPYIALEKFEDFGYDAWVFGGKVFTLPISIDGRYYLEMTIKGAKYYSEVFTIIQEATPYLKIEWWDVDDFVMDAGRIVYRYNGNAQFKNILYLCADIAKPEYIFEEEGETRDGYFFPQKQISEKRYHFQFLASEYLLDVMRFIRMADYAQITKNDQTYSLDTFLLTPEWEGDGDVASVEAEFDTATVAKKLGRAYIQQPLGGDFDESFDEGFNIE